MRALIRISFIAFFLIINCNYSQNLLLEENFNFSGILISNGWSAHSASGTNSVSTATGLSFIDYPSSGIGNSASVSNNGEDVNRSFTATNSGTIYYSLLVNVSNAPNGYFIHLNSSSNQYCRVYIKEDGTGDYEFGLSKFNETEVYTDNDYSFNSTYLLVVKYQFKSTNSTDDLLSLFVYPSGVDFSTEPVTPTLGALGSGIDDRSSFETISLRQYSATMGVVVDGIRVSDSWSQAPLPVELVSFNAVTSNNGVLLSWQTATEVNNYGFEIDRMIDGIDEWVNLGFVQGAGNSNSPKQYEYIDATAPNGNLQYRLKQIDTDGRFEYFSTIATLNNEDDLTALNFKVMRIEYMLHQNYPNPFNPKTCIRFSLPEQADVKLSVYNSLGQIVTNLANGNLTAGYHSVSFDASTLNSGVYFYRIKTSDFVAVKKMTLLK